MKRTQQGSGNEKTQKKSYGGIQGKLAAATLKDDKTLAELAEKFDLHANQIAQWRAQLVD